MFQETLFPGGHHLSGYHYSGDSPLLFRGEEICLLFVSVVALGVRKTTDLDCADLLSGSDCWTAEEKRYFNKGIAAYRKDFIMVQKLVGSLGKCSLMVVFLILKSWINNLFLHKLICNPGLSNTQWGQIGPFVQIEQ